MGDLIIENERPPSSVMDDLQRIRQDTRNVHIRVEAGPDTSWTIRLESETDKETFDKVANLIEEAVENTDEVERHFDRKLDPKWLVIVRY